MATVETVYLGDLRTEATHVQSGNKIITDAPLDNHGRGEYFSPTDMVAAALASCMLTIMGMAAKTHDIDIAGTKVSITKVMSASPRRIGEIIVEFDFPRDYTDREKKILENAGDTCPVAFSLHPDTKQTKRYNYK